ncbi:MAG: hypothetical protein JO336_02340 [Acidobacteriia bacterium]|nr:hypothetical protein [Terriglobia bacterium]MBV8906057.1 hypothetical protein [Terriglobia bacterium]
MNKFLVTAMIGTPLWAQAPAPNSSAGGALPPPGGSIQEDGARAGRAGRGRGPQAPQGPTPRLPDGKPDFSGVWRPDNGLVGDITRILKPGDQILLKPEYEKIMKSRKAGQDPEANCLPTGVPRMAPYPWTIATAPGKLFFLFEGNIHSYRQIFMDGRPHSKDPDPTWYGESIGHWEGDTLVIDTIGFNELFWFDFAGHPHTEKLHVVERYTRSDLGNLVEEILIDDPGAYQKPFTLIAHNRLDPKGEIMEYICQEDNQDPAHIVGPVRPL